MVVNPSESSIQIVNHASDPSLRSTRSSKWVQIILCLVVFLGLCALASTVYLFIDRTERNRQEAVKKEAENFEVQIINAQPLRPEIEEPEIPLDERIILVSLFSMPTGADVFYADGTYFGTTPIEQQRIARKVASEEFIFSLEGYETQTKSLFLNRNIQDTVVLDKLQEVVAPVKKASKKKQEEISTVDFVLPD